MNNARRNSIKRMIQSVEEFCDVIDDIIVEEEIAASNMPESIRNSREFQLRTTIESITKAQDCLLDAQGYLESAV